MAFCRKTDSRNQDEEAGWQLLILDTPSDSVSATRARLLNLIVFIDEEAKK